MMKAVVKAKAEPGLWLEEVPVPKVSGDDVLIRVLKASICGTDVHIYNWDAWAQKTIPVPMTIGHEFVGVVDAVGDHVKGFAHGDRKSTRLNSSHSQISYAVFCLKKKTNRVRCLHL